MLPGIGIFGCGQLTRVLVPFLRAKGFQVEAIWSYNEELVQKTAEEYQIPVWTVEIDRLLLLPSVQLIVIACPPHLHEQIARHACGIGKHVLCDWPPAVSISHMVSMVKAALNYPSLIAILCHSLRFLPAFSQMKKSIGEGKIGQLKVVNVNVLGSSLEGIDRYTVKCDELMGGGILANIGSHIIDIITFITGLKAKRVHGVTKSFCHAIENNKLDIRKVTADDFACFQMEMENNCFSNVTLNSNLFNQFIQEVFACGTNGYLVVRGCDLFFKPRNSNREEILVKDVDDTNENNLSASAKFLPNPYRKGLIRMIAALRDAFQGSPRKSLANEGTNDDKSEFHWAKEAVKEAANFEDGQYIQTVIEAVRFSSRNKEWVRINLKN